MVMLDWASGALGSARSQVERVFPPRHPDHPRGTVWRGQDHRLNARIGGLTPAISFNVDTIASHLYYIRCWDLGGTDKIYPV